MNIHSSRLDALARRLAELTGEDAETALARAAEERLSRLAPLQAADQRRAALEGFFAATATLPIRDPRPIDEILGYRENGLPI